MDCTASMQPYIDACKTLASDVIDKLKSQFPDHNFRVGFVGYRDFKDKCQFTEASLSSDINHVSKVIMETQAYGGGDQAEDVIGAIAQASRLNFEASVKTIAHICDAPAHNCGTYVWHDDSVSDDFVGLDHPNEYYTPLPMFEFFVEKGIEYKFIRINSSTDNMIEKFRELMPSIVQHPLGENPSKLLPTLYHSAAESIRSSIKK